MDEHTAQLQRRRRKKKEEKEEGREGEERKEGRGKRIRRIHSHPISLVPLYLLSELASQTMRSNMKTQRKEFLGMENICTINASVAGSHYRIS